MTEHGITTQLLYDDAGGTGNLVRTVDSVGRAESFGHDAAGNVTHHDDEVASTEYEFDANNRLLLTRDGAGHETHVGYLQTDCGCTEEDQVASIHTPDLPSSKQWALTWLPDGRLHTVVDPEGVAETYDYEPTGELKTIVDRLQRTTSFDHDQLGRLTATTDIAGRRHASAHPEIIGGVVTGADVTAISNSATAAPTSISAALSDGQVQVGATRYVSYAVEGKQQPNDLPQVTFYRDATFELSHGWQFDVAGRTTRRQDRPGLSAGNTTVFGDFLSLTEDIQLSYPGTTSAPLPNIIESNYNGYYEAGTWTYKAEFDVSTTTSPKTRQAKWMGADPVYTRDPAGRITHVAHNISFAITQWYGLTPQPVSDYTYAPNGYLATVQSAAGRRTYEYDTRGLVWKLTVDGEGTYTFEYDELGRDKKLTYPDGHRRVQGYDVRGNLVTRCYEYDAAQLTRCYGATYDAVGNPTSLTDPEGTDVVAVDNLDRLSSVTRQVSGQPDAVESYAHNAMGALSVNAGVAMDHQRPALSNGQLTDAAVPASWNGQPVVLDAGGRITSLGGATLAYNRRNQLVRVTDGTKTEYYDYDVWGRRIGVIHEDNNGDFYVYEGANVEAILHANPGTTAYSTDFKLLYDGIDHPLRVNAKGTVAYYELDIIGNVRRLRGAGGTDLGGYRYTAFGKLVEATATIEQPLRWQGRLYTPLAGGMYDVRAREWSPELAVFVSADEFQYLTTRGTLWGWPMGNPVRWRDPSGRDIWLEGASESEPSAHMSLSIGDPLGQYWSYSFRATNWGEAYLDVHRGGAILAYMKTSPEEDRIADALVWKDFQNADNLRTYGVDMTCRGYSQGYFLFFMKTFGHGPSTPPSRPVTPLAPRSTLDSLWDGVLTVLSHVVN